MPGRLSRSGVGLTAMQSLALVTLVAAALRLAALGHAPLWGDEVATAAFARLPWHDLLFGFGRLEPNPPGFYALEKLWTGVAGMSDLALRLPSALFGIGSVAAVWALTRSAMGLRAATWAGLLMAINGVHLEHSRDARTYALLCLVTALAAIAARRIAVAEGVAWRSAGALAALTGLMFWLHHTGAVAGACVFVYGGVVALHHRGALLRRCIVLGIAGLLGLVAGAPALLSILSIAGDATNNASWIPVPDWFLAGLFMTTTWTSSYPALHAYGDYIALQGFGLGVLVIAVTVAMAARLLRQHADSAGLLAASIAAIVLMTAISQRVPVMVEKTLLFSLVFFLPLLGAAIAALPRAGAALLAGVVVVLQMPGLCMAYAPARHGEDWPGLSATLQPLVAETGWAVVVRSAFDGAALERYMPPASPARPLVSITPRIGAALNRVVASRMTGAVPVSEHASVAELCAVLGNRRGVFLIDRRNPVLDTQRAPATALLTAAGGHLEAEPMVGSLILQRWPGVCASPGPATAP